MVVEHFRLPPAKPPNLNRRIIQTRPEKKELEDLVEEKVENPAQAIELGKTLLKRIETILRTKYQSVYQTFKKDIQQRTFLRRELDVLSRKHIKKYDHSGISTIKRVSRQAEIEISKFMERYQKLEEKINQKTNFLDKAFAKTAKEELSKLRTFSKEYEYLPALWIKVMQKQAPIDIRPTSGRGSYITPADIIFSTKDTELHSIIHRIQASYEPLAKIEAEFWRSTKYKYDQIISWIEAPFTHFEKGIRQGFPDRYVGKYYPDNIFFEIMPIGVSAIFDTQSLISRRIKRNKNFMAFCLGVLAAV